jgi:hypothetical protein
MPIVEMYFANFSLQAQSWMDNGLGIEKRGKMAQQRGLKSYQFPMKKDIRELNQRTIWQKVLRIGGAVILSMFLAYVTEVFARQYWTTLTPGDYGADRIVPGSIRRINSLALGRHS